LDEKSWLKLERLIEVLEEDDDVDSIYHNAN
jgi:transcriptional/translational regulatory protein YebC/TACO1